MGEDREQDRTLERRSGGAAEEQAGAQSGTTAESTERASAWRRAEELARDRLAGEPESPAAAGSAPPCVAERAFTSLADNVREYAIFLLNREGVITFWGEGARLIKWWTREQAEGAHLRLLYPDGGSEDGTADEHLAQAAAAGEYTGEGHRMRSDGSSFWAGVTLTALRAEGGELSGFVKVTRDLTARRAAEVAARAALEVAEEASRLKGQFLAMVSHEIRTPLTSIMAYTDLLSMEVSGDLSPRQHRYLGSIRTSSQHLLELIEDILDVARAEAGRTVVGRGRVRVGSVAVSAMELLEPQASRRGVDMVNAISGAASDYDCWGDGERTRQILLNLLSNAIKFTEPGGRITVSAGSAAEAPKHAELDPADEPWVYFRIEDTGAGIPMDRLDEIFEPFVQVDMSSTRRYGGTGLGLAISRRLARLMGGDVTVRSEVGVGSSFFLWLPAAADESMTARPVEGHAEGVGSTGTLIAVGKALLFDIERILTEHVARLRTDPATPRAHRMSTAELEDHFASFLADVAQALGSMNLADAAESLLVRDGTLIQRTIADRHGRQRARFGWTEQEVRREFEIMREEVSTSIRRQVRRPRPQEVEEVISVVHGFIDQAETVTLAAWRGGDEA
jgi:PAS domain S-box-containing protein